MSRLAPALALAGLLAGADAHASGVDIPALHGARYGGLGGAVLALVDEPSAVYHNPAGLAGIDGLAFTGGVTVFMTNLRTNPDFEDQGLKTGNSIAPGFLVATGWRVHERVTLGFGFYPMGAVGGSFRYDNIAKVDTINEQLALLLEATPALSVQLPGGLSVGAGWRLSYLTFDRRLGMATDPSTVDVSMSGANLTGFRLGAQWSLPPHLAVGVAYRHRIVLHGTTDSGRLVGLKLADIEGDLTVPSKLGAGVRGTWGRVTAAADVEYVFNEQFESIPLSGTLPDDGGDIDVAFLFHWRDSVTAKGGVEVEVAPKLFARAGYAWDQPAANSRYPSTFSAPEAASHMVTAGAGWDAGPWAVNVALGHRFENSRDIAEDEIAPSSECKFCSHGGVYAAGASSLFVDFTIDLGEQP